MAASAPQKNSTVSDGSLRIRVAETDAAVPAQDEFLAPQRDLRLARDRQERAVGAVIDEHETVAPPLDVRVHPRRQAIGDDDVVLRHRGRAPPSPADRRARARARHAASAARADGAMMRVESVVRSSAESCQISSWTSMSRSLPFTGNRGDLARAHAQPLRQRGDRCRRRDDLPAVRDADEPRSDVTESPNTSPSVVSAGPKWKPTRIASRWIRRRARLSMRACISAAACAALSAAGKTRHDLVADRLDDPSLMPDAGSRGSAAGSGRSWRARARRPAIRKVACCRSHRRTARPSRTRRWSSGRSHFAGVSSSPSIKAHRRVFALTGFAHRA